MTRIAPANVTLCFAALCGSSVLFANDPCALVAYVLAHTDAAQQAVCNRHQEAALEQVREAQFLVARIESDAGRRRPLLIPVHSTTGPRASVEELDMTTAHDNLDAAYSAIQHQDWTTAQSTLYAVANLLHIDPSRYPLPLLQAHQELMLAYARVANHEFKAAVIPLRNAEHALSDFEQRDRGPLAQQAEFMRQAIGAMSSHVSRDTDIRTIDDWIHTLEHWENTRKDRLQPPQY